MHDSIFRELPSADVETGSECADLLFGGKDSILPPKKEEEKEEQEIRNMRCR